MSKMGEAGITNKTTSTTTTTTNAADNDAKLTNKVINLFAPDNNVSNDNSKQSVELSKNSDLVINRLSLVNPDANELENVSKYIMNKIEKGHGEMIFSLGASEGQEMGLSAKDMESSVNTLLSLEKKLNISVILLRERTVEPLKNETNTNTNSVQNTEANADSLLVREYLLRRNFQSDDFMEVRVAVVGNVDSGKSTLLGVLTHCVLDDGRGEARTKLFRHKHEIESGRTSSVGNDILGFDSGGNIMNEKDAHGAKSLDWEAICTASSKVITFIDLAGHEKYLKTTVFGMTGHAPDFCMLMVGANMGVVGMTKEHLGLALALNVPVFVVITKIDMCPPNVKEETLKILQKILKSPGCRKMAYLVENSADVVTCALNFTSERLCPIFQVSNVTGQNLDLLRMFLNLLNPRMETHSNEPAEFQIDDIYSVPGVGTVVSGTCYKGVISLNDNLLLGPDLIGGFRNVTIKGIHRKRMPVKECRGGQTASFALKKIKRSELRKGMVLISEKLNPIPSWEFEAEILVLHHPTTISVNYQAMVHCGSIRQTATILEMSVQHMRTGDKATVKFSFIKNPEYLKVGNKMIFREGRTKAIGTITKVNLTPSASKS